MFVIKKRSIIIVVLAITALIIGLAVLWPKTAYTQGQKIINPDELFSDDMNLDEVRETYHGAINATFNEAFKQITSGNANIKSVENESECGPDKEPLNASTYCIAMRTASIYEKYEDTMLTRRTALFDANEMQDASLPFYKQSEILSKMYNRADTIEKDLKNSREALDTTLRAYKEFQYAYPMHKSYEETFKLLVKYRDFMAEIRAQIEKFPSKFIDASTSNCQ